MKHLKKNIGAYLKIAELWPQMVLAYRTSLAFDLLGLLLKVYLLNMVFTAAYAGRGTINGIHLNQVITFVTLANLQVWLLFPIIARYLYGRIRQGQVAFDLARPVPILGQLLAHQVGATAARFPVVLLSMPLIMIVGGLEPPPSATAGLLYLLSLALGYLITVLIALMIGLLGFCTIEIRGFLIIYDFASQFFAGALVPLWFFPPLLRRAADVLPFQAQAFIPISLYIGQISGVQAVEALALQLLWVGSLGGFAWLLWQRVLWRITIQGG